MDFVVGGGGGGSSDNGPILYSEPNRTSAIDDLRSLYLYIFIITILLSFFLIIPGIRNEKFPTFLCITTSLIVTSIVLVSLFGTTWHVGQAPISAPYKAFSKDRIQGELSVKIGLRSVNITLRAHKYYELHATHGPVIMLDTGQHQDQKKQPPQAETSTSRPTIEATTLSPAIVITTQPATRSRARSRPTASTAGDRRTLDSASSLAEELLAERNPGDEGSVESELEVDEVFANEGPSDSAEEPAARVAREADSNKDNGTQPIRKRSVREPEVASNSNEQDKTRNDSGAGQRFTVERSNVDINYNERFFWIEPNQMRQEHHNALERGLPYPILTVVEYLSQDEAGFSWSRQYRLAGYYSYIVLWLSFCVSILMFFLHCAAPKFGIYTMQILGCLLLFTNFTYATLVPRGDQKLVIPFEGQSISLDFGWNYWLVLFGGCLSLFVGTLFVIIDSLFPNFIFTTILDVDFDSHNKYYKSKRKHLNDNDGHGGDSTGVNSPKRNPLTDRPIKPPFYNDIGSAKSSHKSSAGSRSALSSELHSARSSGESEVLSLSGSSDSTGTMTSSRHRQSVIKQRGVSLRNQQQNEAAKGEKGGASSQLSELFAGPLMSNKQSAVLQAQNSEMMIKRQSKRNSTSSVVDMQLNTSDTYEEQQTSGDSSNNISSRQPPEQAQSHYGAKGQTSTTVVANGKNGNLKSTGQQPRRVVEGNGGGQVRL